MVISMLSAADRVILRIGLDGTGFVSGKDLNNSQLKLAKELVVRQMLSRAGNEPDGTLVYRLTDRGREAYEARL